jgi:hypothetical protein
LQTKPAAEVKEDAPAPRQERKPDARPRSESRPHQESRPRRDEKPRSEPKPASASDDLGPNVKGFGGDVPAFLARAIRVGAED